MPTPFYHVALAEDLLADAGLPAPLRGFLVEQRPAFLLGNTAPDVQTVSGQLRESTHFFNVPLTSARPAHEAMFEAFPDLARPERLEAAHAAFMAGYVCHLILDQFWIRDIFEPVFGERAPWGSFRERLYLHNALRAYLDQQVLGRLNNRVDLALASTRVSGWLPFVADEALARWRDLLAGQLSPGARCQTVEVFAARMRVPVEQLEQLVNDPAEMERRVFARYSAESLKRFREAGLAQSRELLQRYLANAA